MALRTPSSSAADPLARPTAPRSDLASSSSRAAHAGLPRDELVDNRYRVEEEIGRGGMGVVYLAHDVNLGRKIALKVIAPSLTSSPDVRESFRREARMLAGLRSPQVVLLHAFGEHRGALFFAMEYVEGVTLGREIDVHTAENRTVPLQRAMRILRDVARGVDAVHAAGTLHRDVKPDNVILEYGTDRCVLIDFGLARGVSASSGYAAATPEYAAPEQSHGADVSTRADGYAFAVMAFELLSGRLPFEGQSSAEFFRKHATEAPRLMSSVRPRLGALDPVFARALAKRPEYRFPSCGAVVEAIESSVEVGLATPLLEAPGRAVRDDSRLHALVLDGDAASARNLARAAAIALHGMNAQVHLARGVEDAIDALRRVRPSLIVVGWDSVASPAAEKLLRERKDSTHVLAMSQTWPRQLDGNGCTPVRWLRKPFTPAELLTALETIATQAGWQRAAVPKRSSGVRPAPTTRAGTEPSRAGDASDAQRLHTRRR